MTAMCEAGWYGIGPLGLFLGTLRLVGFLVGMGFAYFILLCGTKIHRVAVAPAVLGYTAVVIGILVDSVI